MAGEVTYINGKLYYSSVTAGRGDYGTVGQWGGTTITDQNGQMWFPGPWAATAAPTAAPGPSSRSEPLPPGTLEGQTWGWPIPITAGSRDIPGRILWREIRKEGDAFFADVAVSYGWRAEIMAGFDPATGFSMGQHLVNGVVVFEDGISEAPGLTVTAYDGTQTTADPFLEAALGAGNTPAYVFHIYAVYQGLPLEKFGDRLPDAWNLKVSDGAELNPLTGVRPVWSDTDKADGVELDVDEFNPENEDATAEVAVAPGPYQSVLSVDAIAPLTVWAVRVDEIPVGSNYYVGWMRKAQFQAGATWPNEDDPVGVAWKSNGDIRSGNTGIVTGSAPTYGEGDVLYFAWDGANYYLGKAGVSGYWLASSNGTKVASGSGGDPCGGLATAFASRNEVCHVAFGCDAIGGKATLVEPDEAAIPVSCGYTVPEILDGITLKRCYEILGGLSRELTGRVSVANNITDTVDSLFLVESGSFNSFALEIGRFCDCDMRENNDGVEIVRVVDGTSYNIDLTLGEESLLRASNQSGLTFARVGEQNLPSEIVGQFIASEATFRWAERPARRENGPKKTTTSTKRETIRVPLGMPINQGQTYASNTLFRETEARDQVRYQLPWEHAIKVQAADVHVVPDGEDTLTVKVTRADREPNRTVKIIAQRLHTAQDYTGVADAGETPSGSPVATPPKELTLGGVTSTAQVFAPTFAVGAIDTQYANAGGSGNRTGSITIGGTATWAGGGSSKIIDGSQANDGWLGGGQSGVTIVFDFGVGASKVITEFKWYQDITGSQGTWKFQGSDDNASYTDLGGTFTLGTSATQTITAPSSNTSGYRYYRLLQTAGTTSGTPFVREIEFKIADE